MPNSNDDLQQMGRTALFALAHDRIKHPTRTADFMRTVDRKADYCVAMLAHPIPAAGQHISRETAEAIIRTAYFAGALETLTRLPDPTNPFQ